MSQDSANWTTRVVESIHDVPHLEWDSLNTTGNPFVSHAFLRALEDTGCVGAHTGWNTRHLCLRNENDVLVGVIPLYLKYNSYGEFVFDWSWASAYEQNGFAYYPKLVCAVPFSPVTGPRFLISESIEFQVGASRLLDAALAFAGEIGASSLHLLFLSEADKRFLQERGLMIRQDCQFQWKNRNYQCFDDFIGALRSAKRKKLNRERRRVRESGISFVTKTGDILCSEDWDDLFRFYCSPYFARGQNPYLNREFFCRLAQSLGPQLATFIAEKSGKPVAAAIVIRDTQRLYGRYWGSDIDSHSLHFETCYYQGIEFAIRNRLQYFEPGTQGEHKLIRGFAPTRTYSAHWIAHPGFAKAIDDHLNKERQWIDDYFDACQKHLPFRRSVM